MNVNADLILGFQFGFAAGTVVTGLLVILVLWLSMRRK